MRGLEYYTGPIFEAELTFKVKNEKGLDIVSEEKEEEEEEDNTQKRLEGDKKPYISVSQFLINGVLKRSIDNVSNKSLLDEWIIVDKNTETNSKKFN